MGDIIFDILETIASELKGNNKPPVKKQYGNQQRINTTNQNQKKQSSKKIVGSRDPIVVEQAEKKQELQKQVEKKPIVSASNLPDFSNLSNDDVLRGIVFSELLSKPKSLRRGRL
ncbi:UNVERIFIED_CONTAM: hypothetical protein Cloal_1898 [Acetivibrio alkalicellulosi]